MFVNCKQSIAIGSVLLLAVLFGVWRLHISRTFQLFGEVVPRVETSQRIIALTFDDGPTPQAIERLLPMLRERNVKATFFVTGASLKKYPEIGKRIVAEGHELGNHSYSHKYMIFKTPSFISSEIERTDQLIRETGYQGPIYVRPPYFKRLILLPLYLKRHNRKTITCDIEAEASPEIERDTRKIVGYVLEHAKPGSIILMHVMFDKCEPSMCAVPEILDGLKERGYEFKTVTELLSKN